MFEKEKFIQVYMKGKWDGFSAELFDMMFEKKMETFLEASIFFIINYLLLIQFQRYSVL